MTANRMPACLKREIRLAFGEFYPRYEELVNSDGRVIGLHFFDELHMPYENRGLSAMLAVAWRGSVCYIAAPDTGDSTPFTYAAPYSERVAAAVEGIRRLEADYQADYQRQLNDYDRSR